MKKLAYNYYLDTEKRLIGKVEKEENLYWSRGGYPLINRKVLLDNAGQFDTIVVRTKDSKGRDKRIFTIDAKMASENKEIIKHPGYEEQLWFDPYFWIIQVL